MIRYRHSARAHSKFSWNRTGTVASVVAFSATLLASLYAPCAAAAVTLVDKDDWKVLLGGFVETDYFRDSTRSFGEVVGSSPVARGGTFNGDNGRTQFSLRNSRLSFAVLPPVEGEWKTKGYFEFDFLGYEPTVAPGVISESSATTSPTLRMRHGFVSGEKNGLTILVGQTWTLFGWAPLYVPTTASVPPVSGSVYERTPQLTAIKEMNLGGDDKLQTGLSIVRPVQRDAEIPGVDMGVRLALGSRKSGYTSASGERKVEAMSIALSGTGREFISQAAGGATTGVVHHLGTAYAVNGMLPILTTSDPKDLSNTLSLSGEFSRGRGYADEFTGLTAGMPQASTAVTGNTINLDAGQGGVTPTGVFQLVKLQTWNGQLQYHLPGGIDTFVDLGYGQTRLLNVSPLVAPTAGYDRTEVYYANLFHDLTVHVRLAIECDHFVTRYVDSIRAMDNRYQLSTWIRF